MSLYFLTPGQAVIGHVPYFVPTFNQLYHLGLNNDVYNTFQLILPGSIKHITEFSRSTRVELIP